MYKLQFWSGEIKHYPQATRRGETSVYTGEIGRKGRKEYESTTTSYAAWFDTKEEAIKAMVAKCEATIQSCKRKIKEAELLIKKVTEQ